MQYWIRAVNDDVTLVEFIGPQREAADAYYEKLRSELPSGTQLIYIDLETMETIAQETID